MGPKKTVEFPIGHGIECQDAEDWCWNITWDVKSCRIVINKIRPIIS